MAMRRFLKIVLLIAGLLLIPLSTSARSEDGTTIPPPPVGQPLVREGDFAVQLAEALYLGTPQDEADAENMLKSVDIAPTNGWNPDYPMTPDIFLELEAAVGRAAENRQLAIEKDMALQALHEVAEKLGLPFTVAAGENGGQNAGPPDVYYGGNPVWIDNYYDDNGPPVITYYSPPPAYIYLYTWVSYPFWYGRYYFKGYYCLHNFDRTVFVGHAARSCTNHVLDRDTGRVFIINPATGRRGKYYEMKRGPATQREKGGATRVYRHDMERERREYQPRGGTKGTVKRPARPSRVQPPHPGPRMDRKPGGDMRRPDENGKKGRDRDKRSDERNERRHPESGRSFHSPGPGAEKGSHGIHPRHMPDRFHRNGFTDRR